MTKLTDTQLVLLSAASQRPDGAIPINDRLKGGVAKAVGEKLITLGFAAEQLALPPMSGWRENAEGEGLALAITPLGLAAIGVEAEIAAVAVVGAACTEHLDVPQGASPPAAKPSHSPVCDGPWIPSARQDTKRAKVIGLLRQAGGASIDDIVTLTGWLPHTARAALTGLRKAGLTIVSVRKPGSATTYRIADKIDAGAA